MKTTSLIVIILVTTFTNGLLAQQPGDLDVTFDGDGKLTTDFYHMDDGVNALSIQPDGKIVAAGFSGMPVGGNPRPRFTLVRYNTDGALDTSFGTNGKVLAYSGPNSQARSVVVQPDGKIMAAGISSSITTVFRFNSDGSLDSTFNTSGALYTDLGAGNAPLVLQPDGEIIIGGVSYNGTDADFALMRIKTDGSIDSSFGINGKAILDIDSNNDNLYSLCIQADGKVIAAGDVFNGNDHDFAIARFNTDGTLDSSFSGDGKVITAFGAEDDFINAMIIQPDGKIIVAGRTTSGSTSDLALARYNTDGILDNSFSGDGKLTTSGSYAFSLALQADDKIIVAGAAGIYPQFEFALLRYNSDGSLDSSFSTDGKLTTAIDTGDTGSSQATSVAIQSDGKIVLAGFSNNGGKDDFALARYLSSLNVGILSFSPAENVLLYPNPIHSNEVLEYSLQQDEVLSIDLYDISGKLVKQLISSEHRSKGSHKESLNFGEDLSAGNYLLTITNGKGSQNIKVMKQ